jgi:DNA-binding protein HU-beta
MNKAQLVSKLAERTKITQANCKAVLEAFMAIVKDSFVKNEEIALTGLGTFTRYSRKSRIGVNPSTLKKMNIPAKDVLKFRPGKAVRDLDVLK